MLRLPLLLQSTNNTNHKNAEENSNIFIRMGFLDERQRQAFEESYRSEAAQHADIWMISGCEDSQTSADSTYFDCTTKLRGTLESLQRTPHVILSIFPTYLFSPMPRSYFFLNCLSCLVLSCSFCFDSLECIRISITRSCWTCKWCMHSNSTKSIV